MCSEFGQAPHGSRRWPLKIRKNGVHGKVGYAPRPVARAVLNFFQMRRGFLIEEGFLCRTVYSMPIFHRSFIPPFFPNIRNFRLSIDIFGLRDFRDPQELRGWPARIDERTRSTTWIYSQLVAKIKRSWEKRVWNFTFLPIFGTKFQENEGALHGSVICMRCNHLWQMS